MCCAVHVWFEYRSDQLGFIYHHDTRTSARVRVYDYALILSAMKPDEWVREFAIVEPY